MTFILQIQVEADKASEINLQEIEKSSNGIVISLVPQRPAPIPTASANRTVTSAFQQTQTVPTPALNG